MENRSNGWINIGLTIIIIFLLLLTYVMHRSKTVIKTEYAKVEVPFTQVGSSELLEEQLKIQDSLIIANKQSKDLIQSYKRVIAQYQTQALKIPLTIKDTVLVNTTKEPKLKEVKTIEKVVVREFVYADSSLRFKGTVTPTHLNLDTLTVDVDISLLTVKRKPKGLFKFLKKRKTTVIAVSKDPRMKLKGVTSVEVVSPDLYKRGFRDGVITSILTGTAVGAIIKKEEDKQKN